MRSSAFPSQMAGSMESPSSTPPQDSHPIQQSVQRHTHSPLHSNDKSTHPLNRLHQPQQQPPLQQHQKLGDKRAASESLLQKLKLNHHHQYDNPSPTSRPLYQKSHLHHQQAAPSSAQGGSVDRPVVTRPPPGLPPPPTLHHNTISLKNGTGSPSGNTHLDLMHPQRKNTGTSIEANISSTSPQNSSPQPQSKY